MRLQSKWMAVLAAFLLVFAGCSSGGGGDGTADPAATNGKDTQAAEDTQATDVATEVANDDSGTESDPGTTDVEEIDTSQATETDDDAPDEAEETTGGIVADSEEEAEEDSNAETVSETLPTYVVVDTGQTACFDADSDMTCPGSGAAFFGQDAQYQGPAPRYADNGDGTVTDENTGLMWQQDPGEKMGWDAAMAGAESFRLAGYDDWRLPTIKELYSLIDFNGETGMSAAESIPYLDDRYFFFEYGDTSAGERFIDSQFASATKYVSTTMNGDETIFGVNFADGRIKGYGITHPMGGEKEFFVLYVRGNPDYGVNRFADNGDGTITDEATGLTWMQFDSGDFLVGDDEDGALTWEQALAWAEELEYAGYDDWRLPNAKELQSIVDYTRSPDTTGGPAIDPVFRSTSIIDEGGGLNWPFYWTGTTHKDGRNYGVAGVYVAFGEALGFMEMPPDSGSYSLLDVHGAGAQRSDPKIGDPADYPYGFGPQGDVRRIYNYVRCVRGGLTVGPEGS